MSLKAYQLQVEHDNWFRYNSDSGMKDLKNLSVRNHECIIS